MWPKWLTRNSGLPTTLLQEQNDLLRALLLKQGVTLPPRVHVGPIQRRTEADVVHATRGQQIVWQRARHERERLRSLDAAAAPFRTSPRPQDESEPS